jgi:hypothetical protein
MVKNLLRFSSIAAAVLLLSACGGGDNSNNNETKIVQTKKVTLSTELSSTQTRSNDKEIKVQTKLTSVDCTPTQTTRSFTLLGDLNISQGFDNGPEITAEDMALSNDGKTVYIADGSAGLKVIDVSCPTSPKLIGFYDDEPNSCELNGFGRRITISDSGKYVYMADGLAGLKIFDVCNPSCPSLVGRLDTKGFSHGIALSPDNETLFISDNGEDKGTPGLRIIDVSNPCNPQMITQRAEKWATQVVAKDSNTIFVTDKKAGILTVDVSNKCDIKTLGTYKIKDKGISADIVLSPDKKIAYVANKKPGIKVFDISDAANIKLIAKFDTDKIAKSLDLSSDGKTLLIADRHTGIFALDVSNPSSPQLISKIKTGGIAEGVNFSKDGTKIFVANGVAGFKVYQLK